MNNFCLECACDHFFLQAVFCIPYVLAFSRACSHILRIPTWSPSSSFRVAPLAFLVYLQLTAGVFLNHAIFSSIAQNQKSADSHKYLLQVIHECEGCSKVEWGGDLRLSHKFRVPGQVGWKVYLLLEVKGTLAPTSPIMGKAQCGRSEKKQGLELRLVGEGLVT